MEHHSIFFYSEHCPVCDQVLPDVAAFFAGISQPLLVKKITPEYSTLIAAVPALVIRRWVFNTDKELVLIGSRMTDHLNQLKFNYDKLLEEIQEEVKNK